MRSRSPLLELVRVLVGLDHVVGLGDGVAVFYLTSPARFFKTKAAKRI
jgi:hypothetical protein